MVSSSLGALSLQSFSTNEFRQKRYQSIYKLHQIDMLHNLHFKKKAYLKWVSFSFQLNHHRCIHAARGKNNSPSQRTYLLHLLRVIKLYSKALSKAELRKKQNDLIWSARVPRILARSYFVINFDVLRGRSTGSCCSVFSSPSPIRGSGMSSLLPLSSSISAPSCRLSTITKNTSSYTYPA